ncbi:pyroglutamyl-peptidase I [Microaceticoccus formicicus]|uniref:pyroglutamyl-peptidase I n=1 Tax=Microaceticoccus formicicus TaxID=3118105 RepID=UPI003CD0192B|nr:pyroglutamyl-peptidase I [Peptoniphilaceae bacterium AMB_02]
MKILITGFTPFGNENINPSWEAVKILKAGINDENIFIKQIPTVFREAAEVVMEEADKVDADAIVAVGQAGGRASVTVEFIGINWKKTGIPDNAGNIPKGEKIKSDGEDGYISNLPVFDIVDNIKKSGVPAHVSYTAGTYVCNELLYTLMYNIKGNNKSRLAGFIHLPFIPEQVINKGEDIPSMGIDHMVNALKITIETIKEQGGI